MTTTRAPAAIDALVSRFTAVQGESWKTYDGAHITDDFTDAVFVGYDGDPESSFQSIVGHGQQWAGLGLLRRSEEFSVVCGIAVLVGDENGQKAARDKAAQILEAIGEEIRRDPSLGLPSPFVASLRPNEWFTEPTNRGTQVRIPFFVDIQISRV